MHNSVPPILSFSMGTLGFLGEWKFGEYKRAWRECYMSGCSVTGRGSRRPTHRAAVAGARPATTAPTSPPPLAAWDDVRGNGQCMGPSRTSKILLRNRLRVGIYDSEGRSINEQLLPTAAAEPDLGPAAAALQHTPERPGDPALPPRHQRALH